MRSLNWNNIEASSDNGFEPLPAGPYVAKILNMLDHADKEYVELVFDIAEGPKAGYYSDDFGKNHPYTHHIIMSYRTEGGQRMTKGRLLAIQESNPGFDPFAAWDANRLDMFNNRLVGVNLQEEEYENSNGEVRTRLNVCQVVSVQRVRDGLLKAKPKKLLNGSTGSNTSSAEANVPDVTEEIPF